MAEDIFGRKTLEKLGRRLRDAEIPDQKDLDSLQAYRSSYKDVISEVFHIVDENAAKNIALLGMNVNHPEKPSMLYCQVHSFLGLKPIPSLCVGG